MNLQKKILRILKEETKINTRFRRRMGILDDEVVYRLKKIYRPDNICRYESGEELLDVVEEDCN